MLSSGFQVLNYRTCAHHGKPSGCTHNWGRAWSTTTQSGLTHPAKSQARLTDVETRTLTSSALNGDGNKMLGIKKKKKQEGIWGLCAKKVQVSRRIGIPAL